MVGGGPAGSAIVTLACGVAAALEPGALAAGWAAVPVLQAASTTAGIPAASASAHGRRRRIGKATGRGYSAGAVAARSPYLAS